MILSFRSKALKVLWNTGSGHLLDPRHVEKAALVLEALDAAESPEDMDQVGFHFHAPTGDQAGRYAVMARSNRRITFAFEDEGAVRVDYEDYHEGHH